MMKILSKLHGLKVVSSVTPVWVRSDLHLSLHFLSGEHTSRHIICLLHLKPVFLSFGPTVQMQAWLPYLATTIQEPLYIYILLLLPINSSCLSYLLYTCHLCCSLEHEICILLFKTWIQEINWGSPWGRAPTTNVLDKSFYWYSVFYLVWVYGQGEKKYHKSCLQILINS